MTSKTTFALVGGGFIAPLHAKYIQSSPECELVAIVDPFPTGQKLAKSLAVAHYASVSDLVVAQQSPDVYIICVPSGLHVKLATEVLITGNTRGTTNSTPRVILVEKPFCTESASGDALIKLAKEKGCALAVGHHRRFHPAVSAAKEAIVGGKLGKVTAVSGAWTCRKNDGYFLAAQWRVSRSQGGGPVWTNFIHDVDVLQYLVGARVVRVWATGSVARRHHEAARPRDEVEEGAALLMLFANGVVGTFVMNDNVASPYGWEAATGDMPAFPKADVPIDCYRIFGTGGTISVPDDVLWTYDVAGEAAEERNNDVEVGWGISMTRKVLTVGDKHPFQSQIEHLVKVVDREEEPRCSGEDGLSAVKVCEAVIEALSKGDGYPIDIC
ncbi:uncharacterized protein PV06_02322 [Exophiala oligosperma]|uniref:Gfo/Idh/MocA-like oxidoreductase N-terminal domain-containing protein n=2 Tax=Chaetothyriales TaxID=34395 RepID=A0A0D2B391_9EURO|nr:uncharacterized protein PV06_02322 [Exophiala oligosperma]KAJ9640567.1 hypothetical protein H2204_003195 [Knufia peltigerae]KIW46671.1 hypothetical protein PV06_02322 [Exophiala oligosperma]